MKKTFSTITESKTNAYDPIAPYYDRLSRAIFGGSIVKSQTIYIPAIPAVSRVLILGGGTGWLLADLLMKRPQCEYWYLDSSEKMIKMAIQKTGPDKRVRFVHGKLNEIPREVAYDVVIANFFFDQFSEKDLRSILEELRGMMTPHGLLITADFVNDRAWKKIFLTVMYGFFFFMRAITVTRLPDWDKVIRTNGFLVEGVSRFYRGFIKSIIYRKV